MREPWFWRSRSLTASAVAGALSPLALAYDAAQRLRWVITSPQDAGGPVICIGNATLGGVGKTPFAIMVRTLLKNAGTEAWFLTRGYGGSLRGPVAVSADAHNAVDAGDEALLLAQAGNTVISHNRPDGARLAFESGARAVIMDDGYQNPTLKKTLSILLIDGADPHGNGRIFPAGPLREPIDRARARAGIVVAIQRSGDKRIINDTDFNAWLEPASDVQPQRVVAFTGIGVPSKFFTTLSKAGFDVTQKIPFSDHHYFSEQELAALRRLAGKEKAALITTEKDFMRVPADFRQETLVLPVIMRVDAPEALTKRLLRAIDASNQAL